MRYGTPANRAALARRRQRVGSFDASNHAVPQNLPRPPRHGDSKGAQPREKRALANEFNNENYQQPVRIPADATFSTPKRNNFNGGSGKNNAVSDKIGPRNGRPPQARSRLAQNPPQRLANQSTANRQLLEEVTPLNKRVKASHLGEFLPEKHLSSSESHQHEDGTEFTDEGSDFLPEEPEPIVPSSKDVLDASVLSHGSLILLKSISSGKVLHMDETEPKRIAAMTSHFVAEPLEIQLLSGNDSVVRYGQSVALFSKKTKSYLGVQKSSTSINFELGFFRYVISGAETWTILHGNRRILIGKAAPSEATVAGKGVTAAVRSGDSIVFRNNSSGGLISFKESDGETATSKVCLLTQSYNSHGNNSRNTLLDRALHHFEIYPTNSQLLQIWNASVPPCPAWVRLQVDNDERSRAQISDESLREKSRTNQENILLDEVIASLMGLECNVIQKRNDKFYISTEINGSLRSLIERTLPIATGYCEVKKFLHNHQPGYEFGIVMQSVCQEIDSILDEYLYSVDNLEKEFRSLQVKANNTAPSTMNLSFIEIQRLSSTISLLKDVIHSIRDKVGGALLNSLLDLKITSIAGDYHKQKLIDRLLNKASEPWMIMLTHWLKAGELDDPCGEFMIVKIREKDKFNGDNWNNFFSLRRSHVFKGMITSTLLEERILTTGKYWNTIHHCEDIALSKGLRENEESSDEILQYSEDPSDLAVQIEQAYKKSSSLLLRLLLKHFAVEKSLLTLKRYFLLDQGDFLVQFLDTAEHELVKVLENVSRGRTQHWLSMALQLTDANTEDVDVMNKKEITSQPLTPQCIRCSFADESLDEVLGVCEGDPKTPSHHPYGQVTGLTGMMSFSLDFQKVLFPTSLLVSRRNLSSYKMLFRHIFYTKHIEKRLVGVWFENQMLKEFQEARGLLGPTFCLRQRMLHFVQNFLYYMMLEVIDPNWTKMMQTIPKQETVDDLVTLHDKFLENTMEDCLLTNATLFKSLAKTMSTCLTFSEQMRRFFITIGMEGKAKAPRRRGSTTRQQQPNDHLTKKEIQAKKRAQKKAMLEDKKERLSRYKKQAAIITRELKNTTYSRMIQRHADVFDDNLNDLIDKLRSNVGYASQITNLCTRLDYNGYISKQSS